METGQFSGNVILVNGDFPQHPFPLKILQNAKKLICCDGAANELIARGFEPSAIIGDMDSISDQNRIRFQDIIIEISEQETNDQTKAVEWAVKNGYPEVVILGATGKREDHIIGNISLLCNYAKKINICSISDNGIFTPVLKSTTFKSFMGQQVSIFSLTPETKITSKNLKYPLENLQLKSWWMGTLNESLGKDFTVNFQNGELIVFQKFK